MINTFIIILDDLQGNLKQVFITLKKYLVEIWKSGGILLKNSAMIKAINVKKWLDKIFSQKGFWMKMEPVFKSKISEK